MKYLIIACLLLGSSHIFANTKAHYEPGDSYFSNPKVVINNNPHTQKGLGYKTLPEAFSDNSEAKKHAEDHLSYRKWGTGLLFGGLGAALTYGFTAAQFSTGTYWLVFLAGFIPGSVLIEKSNKKVHKAINHYNGIYSQQE